jgi:CelD/BcsL family acetyltransferase involved in cellulose biosynthesis
MAPSVDIITYHSFDTLPPGALALFDAGVFTSAAWYGVVITHALPPGATPCLTVVQDGDRPVAMLPLLRDPAGRLQGLTTAYTCLHQPVLPGSLEPAVLEEAARQAGRIFRRQATVRIDAVPDEWQGLTAMRAGLRRAGLHVQCFENFGNWHEPVAGQSWATYLAARPGPLRETIRRKLKRCEREARLELFRAGPDLERGIAAFEAVYARSWKEPEPFPLFNAALMRTAAGQGWLRLGVLWVGDRPAAAQFWVVMDGQATVLKLAHDEAFKPLSPGTALTALMIQGLLDDEQVAELDFGRGDDPYKALWATARRRRIGLLVVNPWHPGGLIALARHHAGAIRRRIRAARPDEPV